MISFLTRGRPTGYIRECGSDVQNMVFSEEYIMFVGREMGNRCSTIRPALKVGTAWPDVGHFVSQFQEAVHQFAEKDITPQVSETDRPNIFPGYTSLWSHPTHENPLEEYGGLIRGYFQPNLAVEVHPPMCSVRRLPYGAHLNSCRPNTIGEHPSKGASPSRIYFLMGG